MMLTAESLAKSYGKKEVLRDVSLAIDQSSMIGIVGENGSGKSTLLKIIVGELPPDRGTVLCQGRIGYCPQEVLLFSQLTVREHFRYFAAAYELDKERLSRRSEWLMDYFHFQKFADDRIATLSGGTQQKLNLALALLHEPDLLILDEPYSGFDWETYQRFWNYTDELRKEGCAILVITHLLTETGRFDRIYQLQKGRLV